MSILNVGDAVLFVKTYGARPVAGNVHRVTKTQVRVTLVDGTEAGAFNREAFSGQHGAAKSGNCRTYSSVWAKTEENEKELNANATEAEANALEKKAAEQTRRGQQAQRLAEELVAVQVAFGCGPQDSKKLADVTRARDVMPDGSRIYTLDIPVAQQYAERKMGWERVIVRCKNVEDYDWTSENRATVTKVEAVYTYCNGSSGSFASCSSARYATDEEAVWDAVRRQYHSW